MRLPLMSWGWPLRVSVSESKDGAQEAVVCVRRSSCERVTERELLVGRLRVASRLPQYLVMLAQWATCTPWNGDELYHGDVDRCEGARAVDLVLRTHCVSRSCPTSLICCEGEQVRCESWKGTSSHRSISGDLAFPPEIFYFSFLNRTTQGLSGR